MPSEGTYKTESWITGAVVVVALLGAIGLGVILGLSAVSDDEATTTPSATTGTTADGVIPEASVGGDAQAVPLANDAVLNPNGPVIEAVFDGKQLLMTGRVPNDDIANGLLQGAELVYTPFVQNEIVVDPELAMEPWMESAPRAVMMLQTITEGTIRLSAGQMSVTGRAASAEDVAQLEQRLVEATGLPVSTQEIEITNLRPAIYVIVGGDGQIALSGALPTDEIRSGLLLAATAIYGEGNVLDASTVDPGVEPTLWMHSPEALLGTLSAFPEYEVRLDGGAFSASLSGGATFASGSSEITPAFANVLNFGAVVLARDPSMSIAVEGHTDAEGPEDYNLALSQERADAVAAYFMASGVEPTRITAIGMGETSPAAPNDTPEGRARNRRIEFALQSVD